MLSALSAGIQLCIWTGEPCAESSVMDRASFCWRGSGWWMNGRSIQNKNVVLKWGHISLKLALRRLLLQNGFDLLQENCSWKKGNSRGWNVQIRHLIYTILSHSHFSWSWLRDALSSCCWLWPPYCLTHMAGSSVTCCRPHWAVCGGDSVCQTRSRALRGQGSELILGCSISVDSGHNWELGKRLRRVSQLSAPEHRRGEKLNLIT